MPPAARELALRRAARWTILALPAVVAAGCQTVQYHSSALGMAAGIWAGILVLLPVTLVVAPPALVFDGLDAHRAGVVQAEFSPDGQQILFAYRDGPDQSLYTIPIAGGLPEQLAPGAGFVFDAIWFPCGTRIAFVGASEERGHIDLYLVEADGGNLERLTDDAAMELGPQVSPDGTRLVYSRWETGNTGKRFDRASIVEIDLGSRASSTLSSGEAFDLAPRYHGEDVVFVRASGIEAIGAPDRSRFSDDSLWHYKRSVGEAVPIISRGMREIVSYTVVAGGLTGIIYEEDRRYTSENLGFIDLSAESPEPSPFDAGYPSRTNRDGEPLEKHEPVAAPDGASLLFTMNAGPKDESSYWSYAPLELHQMDLEKGTSRQLTEFGKQVKRPRFSPDGQHILFLLNDYPARRRERNSLWILERPDGAPRAVDIAPLQEERRRETSARSRGKLR